MKMISTIQRLLTYVVIALSPVLAFAQGANLTVSQRLGDAQADAGGLFAFFNSILGVFTLIAFIIMVSLAFIAILEFTKHGQWDKIQNKVMGIVFFFALSAILGYFNYKETQTADSTAQIGSP